MKCPYCLSDLETEAQVCKTCSRDIYLFKPLLSRIEELEARDPDGVTRESYEQKIDFLETQLAQIHNQSKKSAFFGVTLPALHDGARFVFLPLLCLVLAHAVITEIYDYNILNLRIISLILPLPFGFALFSKRVRAFFPWLFFISFMAMATVIGMSWVTSITDGSPVFPAKTSGWRIFIEYAACISLSFFAGMVMGKVILAHQVPFEMQNSGLLKNALMKKLEAKDLSTDRVHSIMTKLNDYGGTVVALSSTGASIFIGLKDFFN